MTSQSSILQSACWKAHFFFCWHLSFYRMDGCGRLSTHDGATVAHSTVSTRSSIAQKASQMMESGQDGKMQQQGSTTTATGDGARPRASPRGTNFTSQSRKMAGQGSHLCISGMSTVLTPLLFYDDGTSATRRKHLSQRNTNEFTTMTSIYKYHRYATANFDVDPDRTIPDIEEQYPKILVGLASLPVPSEKSEKKESPDLASVAQVFSFGSGPKKRVGLTLGLMCAILSGCTYPALAFILSTTFRTLSAPTSEGFLDDVTRISFIFMGLGAISFLSMTAQSALLETAAGEMTFALKTSWFQALLRQDMTYYDMKDVSGTATLISTAGAKYKTGVGRKLGEGVQFFITFLGGFFYAFYASWKTSLILLAVVPIMSASFLFLVKMNQSQTKRANESYAEAGSVVYMTVSAIRTVFSLNACEGMIEKYANATERAYQAAASRVPLLGLANGMVMGSMIGLRNVVLTLYGTYLLYDQVQSVGCDPSGNLDMNPSGTCNPDGSDVFGALIGITLGAAGLPQISVALEAFTNARAACQPALVVMNRTVGSDKEESIMANLENTCSDRNDRRASMALPRYVIDSSSQEGKKPSTIAGNIEFRDVSFAYPTRMDNLIFDGFSLSVPAGQTVALVGASGCGKSTTVALLERFYDITSGSITIDGIEISEINLKWLRQQIGLVSQEPTLFARSIRENIAYGNPGASQEQVEDAAKLANAHDFIASFPNGYDTHVGDKGAQLSGGQKQRIALARAVLKRPKILLLDEATSALDSESESVVQAALDKLLESSMTTIVIAHRLSTIRDADLIAVVDAGRIVEKGNHHELMALKGHYYMLVEAQTVSNEAQKSLMNGSTTEGNELTRESLVGAAEPGSTTMDDGQLIMRDVHFCYPTRKRNMVFKGLNLTVRRGETLAIVGPSGGGKSTIVSLIERFYDPSSGSIQLDGIDLRNLNVKFLRDQLGLVSQEATLFDATIGENIRYGKPSATQEEIEDAARRANAHDFITSFPDGYNTYCGERGTQVSGGQKQRIAIARAILKPRQILLLDEATSALDSESEQVVQAALDKLMRAKSQTAIVVAHRLSTLRCADRIAVIADGKVKEIGTHDELLSRPNGRYKRLSMFQSLDGGGNTEIKSLMAAALKDLEKEEWAKKKMHEEAVESEDEQGDEDEEDGSDAEKSNIRRARLLAKDDLSLLFIGGGGALLAGLVFPACGILFGYTIELLYKLVIGCDVPGLPTCESIADAMQDMSFKISYGWLAVLCSTIIGNVLLWYGFGTASERMNKRVRDAAFGSLVRQEVAFFDQRSVGSITSQLQDDAAMIHAFSGEPIRTFVVSLASLLVGLIISFFFMWPFALLVLAILPFMAFGAKIRMKMFMGEDEGVESDDDDNSPGGIVVETLLNMRTVASLTIEEMRSTEYSEALRSEDPSPIKTNFFNGLAIGLGQLFQQWGMALMFFWGGWLLFTYPGIWSYRDFLISMFSLLVSISGMTTGTQGSTDKEKAKKAAGRIFHLIDRESAIDPLSDTEKKTG